VLSYFSIVGGRTVRIRIVHTARERGHENRGSFGTVFKADLRVLLVSSGPYKTVRTGDCVHGFRGTIFWEGRTTVQTCHRLRSIIFGTVFSLL
jgi:hypothetical protein